MTPRPYTADEVRERFLDCVRMVVREWANNPSAELSALDRCEGVAFSILNIFDGTAMALPGMNIALAPHPDDKADRQSTGDNWYEPDQIINDCYLHELFCKGNKK